MGENIIVFLLMCAQLVHSSVYGMHHEVPENLQEKIRQTHIQAYESVFAPDESKRAEFAFVGCSFGGRSCAGPASSHPTDTAASVGFAAAAGEGVEVNSVEVATATEPTVKTTQELWHHSLTEEITIAEYFNLYAVTREKIGFFYELFYLLNKIAELHFVQNDECIAKIEQLSKQTIDQKTSQILEDFMFKSRWKSQLSILSIKTYCCTIVLELLDQKQKILELEKEFQVKQLFLFKLHQNSLAKKRKLSIEEVRLISEEISGPKNCAKQLMILLLKSAKAQGKLVPNSGIGSWNTFQLIALKDEISEKMISLNRQIVEHDDIAKRLPRFDQIHYSNLQKVMRQIKHLRQKCDGVSFSVVLGCAVLTVATVFVINGLFFVYEYLHAPVIVTIASCYGMSKLQKRFMKKRITHITK